MAETPEVQERPGRPLGKLTAALVAAAVLMGAGAAYLGFRSRLEGTGLRLLSRRNLP